jgi:predicted RNA-binding Zn-ribbon protein involved in translation (DUF1610 family)
MAIAPSGGAHWNEHRRRRTWFFAVSGTYLFGMTALWMFTPDLTTSGLPFNVITIAGIVAILVTGLRVINFPCPRCGNLYFCKGWRPDGVAQFCVHCGLPKWVEVISESHDG